MQWTSWYRTSLLTFSQYVQTAIAPLTVPQLFRNCFVCPWKQSTVSFKDFLKYFSAKIVKPNILTFRFSKQSKQLKDEQIVSLVDFVSNLLEISMSCMHLQYVLTHTSGAKISCFCRFCAGIILSIPGTDLRLAEQIKYSKVLFTWNPWTESLKSNRPDVFKFCWDESHQIPSTPPVLRRMGEFNGSLIGSLKLLGKNRL